ncbi:MAG: N-6 DNA methylase [Candidatus Thorarchaeota archaeon]
MNEFIDFLEREQILRKLKKVYNKTILGYTDDFLLDSLIKDLKKLDIDSKCNNYRIEIDSDDLELDIFSSLYEDSLDYHIRKRGGEFYTPITVVNYILKALDYYHLNAIENKKIIDISCGSGSFIIQSIKFFVKRYLKICNRKHVSNLRIEEAKDLISKIKKNITGVDINQIACILCQINIYFVLYDIFKIIRSSDPNYQIPFFNIKNCDALTLDYKKKYDYVVGNPPYLFIRDIPLIQREIIETSNFETSQGQYDYYQLFLELGIKILKRQGLLGYIVPDSLLVLSNRNFIRKYIYNNAKIRRIYHVGSKFNDPVVSNVIIILEKEKNAIKREKNQIAIEFSKTQENVLLQELIGRWNYKFLIHLNNRDISLLNKLNLGFSKLKDLDEKYGIKIILSRGVELSKTGKVVFCQKCGNYYPLPKSILKCNKCNALLNRRNVKRIIYDKILNKEKKNNFKLFLFKINRYQNVKYKFIDTSKLGINYKNLNIYKDRIIIRQISQNNRICASYDKKLSLTSQSFYNLKIDSSSLSGFNHFYLLGLINSTLFSYFFLKSFGSYKKLFPRILIEKIQDFPIKIPISINEKKKAEKIIEMVKLILEDVSELEKLQKSLDLLIFDLYKISESDQEYILNFINSISD